MLVFCLCVGFAQAQSPQAVNFLPRGSSELSQRHFAVQGNTLWFANANALVKLNTQNYTQTIYKPDNSDVKGGIFTSIASVTNSTIYATTMGNGFFTFDGVHFSQYDTLTSGEKIRDCFNLVVDSANNAFMLAYLYDTSEDVYKIDVVKFDGNVLSRLDLHCPNHWNGLYNNLAIDKHNYLFCNVWANGNAKIYKYNGISWDSTNVPFGYIVSDSNLDVWLVPGGFSNATTNYSFYKWNGTSWQNNIVTFTNPQTISVLDVTVDANGNIWFNGEDKIVKKAANSLSIINSPSVVPANPSVYSTSFSGFVVMPNGEYWCYYSYNNSNTFEIKNELWHYNMGNWQSLPLFEDFDNYVDYVYVDKWNRKWAVSYGGIYLLSGSTWQHIPLPPNYSNFSTYYNTGLHFDVNGNLMYILRDINNFYSVWKYDGVNWSLVTTNCSQNSDIAISDLGEILITRGFIGAYYNGNVWTNLTFSPLGFETVDRVAVDKNQQFWLNFNDGRLVAFDKNNLTWSTPAQLGVFIDNIDKNGNIWLFNAGKTACYRFNGTNTDAYDLSAINSGLSYIHNPNNDLSGNLWVATNKGIAKFNGQNWTFYNKHNADFIGRLQGLSIDIADNIWVTDEWGITVFNESGISNNFNQPLTTLFKGSFYYDNNSNGIRDANDYGLANQKVNVSPSNSILTSNSVGNYQFVPDSGTYYLLPMLYADWQQTSATPLYVVQTSLQGVDSLDFGLKGIINKDSLELHIWNGNAHCNWHNYYFITYQNKGNTPLSGDIIFTIDSLETFSSAYPNADSLSPFVYSWHFSNLMPFQIQNISVTVQSPNWQAMGQTINGNAHAIGTNINVTTSYSDILLCSYDPNDKTSTPLGEHYRHQIKPNCPLEYLIRFQNTGNDVAFNIAVEDTISPYLDMNTFELLGSSHFVETKYAQNGAVRFEFPLIMLPDSNQNEALSHGFVAYRIKPKANVPLPAVIENTAFIYFDQNPAVVTNTTRDTMTQFYTGINAPTPQNELLISPNPFDNQTIVTYPNPYGEGCEVSVYDLSGKQLLRKMDNTGRFSIEKGNLQSGMYLLKVKGRREMSAKLVVE